MNELASLGLILLCALGVGHLVKFARIPEVTGYLIAGMLVGPSGVGWVSHDNLQALHVFSEVGLGLILFSIGGVFEFSRMRAIGRSLVTLTFAEKDGRTTVTSLTETGTKEVRDMIIESGMEGGMQDAMDLLEDVAISLI